MNLLILLIQMYCVYFVGRFKHGRLSLLIGEDAYYKDNIQ